MGKEKFIDELKYKLNYLSEEEISKVVTYYSEIIDTICGFIVKYPVGTKLLLDDASIGIVVKQNDKNSEKPIVQIIQKGERTKDISTESITLINLEKDTDYSILDVQEH